MQPIGHWSAAFALHLREGQTVSQHLDLEGELVARISRGRAAWPAIHLDTGAFVRWIAERTVDGKLPSDEHAADLYLACACAAGTRGAVETFERAFFHHVERAISRIDRRSSFIDDALQTLREKLFVGAAGAPSKIANYAGRAPVVAWLCAAGVRTALNLRRNRGNEEQDELAPEMGVAMAPELDHIRQKYKGEFETSVRAAFDALGDRDRTLLRLHYANRLGIDHLGRMYKVGRSTAHRWLAAARERLLEMTTAELTTRLGISESEFDSLAVLIVSDLGGSFLKILEPQA